MDPRKDEDGAWWHKVLRFWKLKQQVEGQRSQLSTTRGQIHGSNTGKFGTLEGVGLVSLSFMSN